MGVLDGLNKVFDNRVRLGIMSILMVNERVDYNTLKQMLELTDGNLASHIKALEKAEYVLVSKEFVGKKPKTSYQITQLGKLEFKRHLANLEKLVRGQI